MDTGRARGNHPLHQFKGIEHTAKPRLGIRDYWDVEVGAIIHAFAPLDLIGPPEGVVDAIHHRGGPNSPRTGTGRDT